MGMPHSEGRELLPSWARAVLPATPSRIKQSAARQAMREGVTRYPSVPVCAVESGGGSYIAA